MARYLVLRVEAEPSSPDDPGIAHAGWSEADESPATFSEVQARWEVESNAFGEITRQFMEYSEHAGWRDGLDWESGQD